MLLLGEIQIGVISPQLPAPAIEQIEQQLFSWLNPGSFKPLRDVETPQKLRDRLLTLPVMMAVVVSLVYRRIPSLSEVLRVLEVEGLLWVEPLNVTKQALSKRLTTLPAQLFAQVFEQVMERMQATQANLPVAIGWESVQRNFTAVWIADGSTLEALKKKLQALQQQATPLAGKMMMVVEAFHHHPVATWYSEKATANDKTWADDLLARLPVGGLLIFDLGFFDFVWFDAFTNANKFFVTRLRRKTAYKVNRFLSQAPYYRDEIIQMGQYLAL